MALPLLSHITPRESPTLATTNREPSRRAISAVVPVMSMTQVSSQLKDVTVSEYDPELLFRTECDCQLCLCADFSVHLYQMPPC
jgi:hypothetical protein